MSEKLIKTYPKTYQEIIYKKRQELISEFVNNLKQMYDDFIEPFPKEILKIYIKKWEEKLK